MGTETVEPCRERGDDGDEVVGEFGLRRVLGLGLQHFEGRPVGGEHLPQEVHSEAGEAVLMHHDDPGDTPLLNGAQKREEPFPVELQPRAEIAEQFRVGVGLFELLDLTFEVVLLRERGDAGKFSAL